MSWAAAAWRPLAGAAPDTCELRKMYFLREARGRGWGEVLLRRLLAAARGLGYRTCYLETLAGMDAAQKLYARMGFASCRGRWAPPATSAATVLRAGPGHGPRGGGDL